MGGSRPWRRWSTHTRLTLATATVIAAVLALGSVGAVLALRHTLLASLDTTAADDAADVVARLSPTRPAVGVTAPEPDAVVQVLDAGGRVVGGSGNAPTQPLLPAALVGHRSVTATGRLPLPNTADGYHIAALRTASRGTVLVALPSDDVTDAVRKLVAVLLVGVPLLFVVLVALAWVVLRRALAPVERMYRRQREFVADAAHELRTPLAALAAQLEADDSALPAGDRAALVGEVARVSGLVDGLLALTRADEGQLSLREVDLDDVVLASLTRARMCTDLPIEGRGVAAVRVSGDAVALSRLVDNLLDNAAKHAASTVTVALCSEGATGVLTVADDGPGIAESDRQRIFERFTRVDGARSRQAGGVGLGLAIVKAIARAHGGDVTVVDNSPGARFVVRMPIAPS